MWLSIQASLDPKNCATFEAAQQESQNNFQTFVKCVKTKVFVMEVVVKLLLLSPRVYFTGTNYAWNIGATWAGILNPPQSSTLMAKRRNQRNHMSAIVAD